MVTKVRGRPRSFDPDEALQRATDRFRTYGFAGTSLDEGFAFTSDSSCLLLNNWNGLTSASLARALRHLRTAS